MEIALLLFALAVLVFAIGGVILVRRSGRRPDPPARSGPGYPPGPSGPPAGGGPVGPAAGPGAAGSAPAPAVEPAAPDGYISLYTFQPNEDNWRCPNCDGENPQGESRCRICGQPRV